MNSLPRPQDVTWRYRSTDAKRVKASVHVPNHTHLRNMANITMRKARDDALIEKIMVHDYSYIHICRFLLHYYGIHDLCLYVFLLSLIVFR
jgi:hypothetical protein